MIVKSVFDAFGAGMPDASTEEGLFSVMPGGWLEWTVNRPVPEIILRVGGVANHTLTIKARQFLLAELTEPGTAVAFRVRMVSFLATMKGRCMAMSQEEKDTLAVHAAGTPPPDVDEVSKEELEEILRKVDKEYGHSEAFRHSPWLVYWIGVAFSSFQVYTAAFGLLPAQLQRSMHLAFVFVLIYLLYPFRSSKDSDRLRWHDYLLAAFAGFVGLYIPAQLHAHHGGRRRLCSRWIMSSPVSASC